MDKEQLQAIYLQEGYYWGTEPTNLAKRLMEYLLAAEPVGRTLVELGAGEGRDSVFFAKQGLRVTAMDIAPAGLAKVQRLAGERGVEVTTIEADINDFTLNQAVDAVYSIGTLQYIHPDNRARQFRNWQEMTAPGGYHLMFAFTQHSDVEMAPDWGRNEYLFERGELERYYQKAGFEIPYLLEYIFDCNSSNIPHRHFATVIVARKKN
ncbi:SAM-dependent methyltransferase [Brevibacillus dissolubilis]|uniref:SAM-dependent methyltransferase n=1 Tax=Brevibacillus dissolubilis TaxID=1844116 RepID=UPI001116CC22|nr:methyltransferase domain-containing protein [Brevibacillus dissolubilis]